MNVQVVKAYQVEDSLLPQLKLNSQQFAKAILSPTAPGNGEMKKRMRELDWSKTVLGPMEHWPICLLSTVSMMLSSHFPYLIFWGPQFTVLYNDAYIPIIGLKHPHGLGLPAAEVWGEVWDLIKGNAENCYTTGTAIYFQDALFFLERYGYTEEAYFTYSFGAVLDETLKVGGICIPQVESTQRVITERRLNILKEAAAQTNKSMTLNEACSICTSVFGKLAVDIPFSLVYLMDESKKSLVLKSQSGYTDELPSQIPLQFELKNEYSETKFEYKVKEAFLQKEKILKIEQPIKYMGVVPISHWKEEVTLAVAIQLSNSSSQEEGAGGVLIVGINTRRAFDNDYQTFIELLASQLSKAISTAVSYEHEKRKAEELAKLDEAKTAFFTNISHEFRTPLTLILSGLEQLLQSKEERELSKTQRENIEMISRNSKRLLKLVNSLLDFSRIEAGRTEMSFRKVDIVTLTRIYVNMFESIIKREGLEYEFTSEEIEEEEEVYVDVNMWEKIIMNLISNAFKFTLKGKIEVKIRKNTVKECLEVEVKDRGVGIETSEMGNLFKRFYRIEGSKGRSFEGSGIGLALVQELVKYHGGSIEVKSEVGEGSEFVIQLPFGKAHLPREKIQDTGIETGMNSSNAEYYLEEVNQWINNNSELGDAELDSNTSGTTTIISSSATRYKYMNSHIVVVDDNADIRNYIQSILSPLFQVHLCCDGEEAYNYVIENRVDLILSDVMMPKMDGFELIKLLRKKEDTKSIPIILLSARAGEESKIEGLQIGASDYLVKTSFSAKELIARVIVHLELSELRKQLKEEVKEKEKMVEKLREIQQTQEEFIDTVCHEIRNPLSGILGSSEVIQEIVNESMKLIKEGKVKEVENYLLNQLRSISNCIANIQECVTHQTMIANDVLSLSKIDAGKIEMSISTEQISGLIQSSIGLFRSQMNEKQLTMISKIDEEMEVEIDGRKYKQIVINFLSNAIKFSNNGKRIWIEVEYENNGLKTIVRDEGKGMSVEEQKQLFQRFSQVNHSKGNKYEGFGLGLAICSKLIQVFGGKIEVKSEKEVGTTFTFYIPCKLSPKKIKSSTNQREGKKENTTISKEIEISLSDTIVASKAIEIRKPILVVEDNAINQKVMKRMLSSKGIEVEIASNGKEAVMRYEVKKYALIFMDVIMPEMNGLEATKKIREMDKEIVIIGLSGNARQEHQTMAMEAGMNDYITKPVLSETVYKILNKYCE